MSLHDILKSPTKPSRKRRLLLCYQLAKAFWNFYGSNWMTAPWTNETVLFMFDQMNEPGCIFLDDPYLAASDCISIKPTVNPGSKDRGPVVRSHQSPKILALGIMLIEIEFGRKIEDFIGPQFYLENGELDINAKHVTARRIYLESREMWENNEEVYPQIQQVIATCLAVYRANKDEHKGVEMLSHDPFMTFTETNPRDLAGIRHAIEEHIVRPIKDLCSHTFWPNKPDPQEWDCPPFSIGNPLNKPVVSDRVPTISAVDKYVPTLFRELLP